MRPSLRWDDLHSPIRQDALLLAPGADSAAARALLKYLQGDAARAVIRAFGYDLDFKSVFA